MSLIGGPMLNDTQELSMVQRLLQRLCIFSTRYIFKEIFLITWPCNAYPSIGAVNLRCRQRPVSNISDNDNQHQYFLFHCSLKLYVKVSVNTRHIACSSNSSQKNTPCFLEINYHVSLLPQTPGRSSLMSLPKVESQIRLEFSLKPHNCVDIFLFEFLKNKAVCVTLLSSLTKFGQVIRLHESI